jgi:hypothetical protein
MPWIIGLDEAGYGPNLGPLVQTAVAAHVPDRVGCLWACLAAGVRRAGEPDDGRVLIDDSKLVYGGPQGLARLERGVLAIFGHPHGHPPLGDLLAGIACGPTLTDLAAEPWFTGREPHPVLVDPSDLCAACQRLGPARSAAGVAFRSARCVATPAPRFNYLLDCWHTKSAVLEQGVITLLRDSLQVIDGDETVTFVIDKQGGRNFYAPMIQTAFPDGWVVPLHESAELSEYRIDGLGRGVQLVFRPRADSSSLPVALASMLAKYLREVFMRQLNRFWQTHIPGLEPTAGYPGDARRFYEAIRPAMTRLGIADRAVWRRK